MQWTSYLGYVINVDVSLSEAPMEESPQQTNRPIYTNLAQFFCIGRPSRRNSPILSTRGTGTAQLH